MKAHTRVPRLNNPDIVIRTPHSDAEIRAANQLVFENYVNVGFWKDDARVIEENPWINSPHREIFVAACKHEIVGTFSIIHDSQAGLPSDSVQPMWLRRFRQGRERLAEGSAFAIKAGRSDLKNLHLFMMACYLQYGAYYSSIERLVQVCVPVHARFYARVLRFETHGAIVAYDYAHTRAQLLSMNLLKAHEVLSEHYEAPNNGGRNLYRFFLTERHRAIDFGDARPCRGMQHADRGSRVRSNETPPSSAGLAIGS